MQVGYARVSKQQDQDTAAQLRALEAAGAERVFTEHASGGRWDRPELHKMLDQLREGDTVIVWKLDRLSRSLKDVLHLMEMLGETGRGVPQSDRGHRHHHAGRPDDDADGGSFCGVRAGHDPRADQGGIWRRPAWPGVSVGRKRKLLPHQEQDIRESVQTGRRTAAQCARLFEVHPSTITRLLQRQS